MDSTRKFQIRTANREEMDIIVDWAAREGWNPGIHDAEYFYSTDPEGYFVAYLDDEIVGAVSAVAYSSSFGFIGFFMVKPEYRGHRIGIKLGYKALEYLEDCNIGLDGVENKIRNYETYGFKLVYNNILFRFLQQAWNRNGWLKSSVAELFSGAGVAIPSRYFQTQLNNR